MTKSKHNDSPTTQQGATPQRQERERGDERDVNAQRGNAQNAGQKDGDPSGAQSRRGLETPPAKSGGGQVDLKPGSADAGVTGGRQPLDLPQGSQRQKNDLQGRDGNRQQGGAAGDDAQDPFDAGRC
jgi:hypothetical protein